MQRIQSPSLDARSSELSASCKDLILRSASSDLMKLVEHDPGRAARLADDGDSDVIQFIVACN